MRMTAAAEPYCEERPKPPIGLGQQDTCQMGLLDTRISAFLAINYDVFP